MTYEIITSVKYDSKILKVMSQNFNLYILIEVFLTSDISNINKIVKKTFQKLCCFELLKLLHLPMF